MKYIFILLALLSIVNADKINKKSLACPDIDKLKKAPVHEGADPLDLSMYIVANDCKMLSKCTQIEAIGYDPRNSTEIFQKILDKDFLWFLSLINKNFYILFFQNIYYHFCLIYLNNKIIEYFDI